MTLTRKNEGMFPNLWNDMFENDLFPFSKRSNGGDSVPAVNIHENENNYDVELAVPGMKKENISIDVDGEMLVISAENKAMETKDEGKVTLREFNYRNFKRSFTLPENVNIDEISAKYEDGILNINIPKNTQQLPESVKKIQIK